MEMSIDGMHCPACVRRVRAALEKLGAEVQKVEIGRVKLTGVEEAAAKEAIEKAGYTVR